MSTTTFKNPRAKHNFQGRSCSITSVGSYVPERTLTNADLEKMVETSDDWIFQRTGMRERRIAAPDESTASLATIAARRALEDANLSPQDLDLIIIGTLTPDMITPSTACIVQHNLGIKKHI